VASGALAFTLLLSALFVGIFGPVHSGIRNEGALPSVDLHGSFCARKWVYRTRHDIPVLQKVPVTTALFPSAFPGLAF